MGRIDAVTNQYVKNNNVFADVVNHVLYGGNPIIRAENLRDLDTTVYLTAGILETKEKRRTGDVSKAYVVKEDSSNIYMIISVENQSISSLIMPVRILLGDALRYMDQIRQKTAEYESLIQKNEFKWVDATEKLSGIRYTDRLKPVCTIVIHWEGIPWRGPHNLHDMLAFEGEEEKKWIPDWPLYLLDAVEFDRMDQEDFQSDLGRVLYLIQSDKKILKEIKEGRHEAIELTSDAKRVVKEITGLNIPEKGVTEVTGAVKEYLEELRAESKEQTCLENIRSLIVNLGRPAEEVMDLLEIPKSEREKYRLKL